MATQNAIVHTCGRWWTGLGRSHCPSCHLTFSCESAAERHRVDRRCVHPADVGLVARPKPYGDLWGWRTSDTYNPAARRQDENT